MSFMELHAFSFLKIDKLRWMDNNHIDEVFGKWRLHDYSKGLDDTDTPIDAKFIMFEWRNKGIN